MLNHPDRGPGRGSVIAGITEYQQRIHVPQWQVISCLILMFHFP